MQTFKIILIVISMGLPSTLAGQQLSLTASNYNGFNISCFGGRNGAIDLTITGGTPPYTIEWSNGALTEDLSAIPSGYYSVRVDDADLQTNPVEGQITLSEPRELKIESDVYKYPNSYNISLFGACNGSITNLISEGVAPYTYLWNDGPTTKDRVSLCANKYFILVTDNNGCIQKSEYIQVTQPERSDWQMTGNSGTNISNHFIGTIDNQDLSIKTFNQERMNIRSNGDLKINSLLGGAGPVFVDDDGVIRSGFTASQAPCNGIIMPIWQSLNPNTIFTCSPNVVGIGTYIIPTGNRIAVNGNSYFNGNIGVGTSTPAGRLELKGASSSMYITDNSTNSNSLNLKNNNGFWHLSGPRSAENGQPLSFFWNNNSNYTRIMSFMNNGSVVIGIDPDNVTLQAGTSPYKLIVNGKLGANEIWTSLGAPWPDFVFMKNYHLMPLNELEIYLDMEKHLPGMPSSSEVESQNKINITEIQIKQLEKLEEAYLYILQLKNEQELMKQEIKELKEQINTK